MPSATLLFGGSPIGEEDVGYGPARALQPDEVASFHAHITSISDQDFDARFNAQALLDAKIYPDIWDRDLAGEADGRPYLNEYFTVLKRFFAKAADARHGVVIALN